MIGFVAESHPQKLANICGVNDEDCQITFRTCQFNIVNKLRSDNLCSLTNHDTIIIELSKCKLMLYKLQYNL